MMRRPDDAAVRIAVRCARASTRILPGDLRDRHGAAMSALFERIARDAWVQGGAFALIRCFLRAQQDVLVVALRETRRRAGDRHPHTENRSMLLEPADIRQAARALMRRPGLALTVILTLGLAMGATTAVLGVVDGVLLRPLPYPDSGRLYRFVTTYSGEERSAVISYPDWVDYRDGATLLDGTVFLDIYFAVLTGEGEATRERLMLVTDDFFGVLGIGMQLGRGFLPEEQQDGRDRVVVLSHGLWQRRYGGDPAVVGKQIEVDGTLHEIVGVATARFADALPAVGGVALWRPFGFGGVAAENLPGRGDEGYIGLARVRSGVTRAQANAELAQIADGIARVYPQSNEGQGVVLRSLRDVEVADTRPALLVFLGAVGVLLMIAVANVTGVMLARGRDRLGELALRAALGAEPRRLLAPALAESLLLAVAGGALGVVLGVGAIRWVTANAVRILPLAGEVRLDVRVMFATFAIVAGTGLVTGLATAIPGGSRALTATLREGGRGIAGARRHLLRSGLIVVQVALTLMLLTGAALLLRSYDALLRVDPGFDAGAIAFRVDLPDAFYEAPPVVGAFYDRLLERIESIPGVTAAGTVSWTPFSSGRACGTLADRDDPDRFRGQDMCAEVRAVSPGYFEAMGISLLRGRNFDARDGADAPDVVIVSEGTVRLLWPDTDPIGQSIRTGFGDRWHEVIGVVPDVKQFTLAGAPPPQTYIPAPQWSQTSRTVIVRASGPPSALYAQLRGAVREMDTRVPVSGMQTMQDLVAGSLATPRVRALLLSAFAAIALALAAVGLYGTLSWLVNSRRRELAVRRSVGAHHGALISLVLRDGMRLALPGVLLGLGASIAGAKLLRGLLFGVAPTDPGILASVCALVLATALAGCLVPALRATRMDPMRVLRED